MPEKVRHVYMSRNYLQLCANAAVNTASTYLHPCANSAVNTASGKYSCLSEVQVRLGASACLKQGSRANAHMCIVHLSCSRAPVDVAAAPERGRAAMVSNP